MGEKTIHERKIRVWAYKNAYTLFFLSGLFVVTWIIIAAVGWYFRIRPR